jgi:hypothetical protein
MFNAGVRGKRAKDSTGLITVGEHFNQQNFLVPTVTRFAVTDGSYVDTNDTAADPAGNQVIVLYGSGFAPGATVLVGSTTIGAVTFLDSGRLTFSSPALGSGSYTIFVTNANGGTGILVPGLVYSGVPTFTTAAGSLGSVYETTAISTTVVATGDAPITYAISSGSLPSGSTLSSSGTISGTAPVDGSSTTYSFTVQATDAQNQDSVRSFSLTINTDVVSFSSPANNTSYSVTQNSAISNVTTVATSAAGYGVLYTSSGLPTGLSMNTSTGIISGTPTIVASNTSIITATANTTSRTAALYLNWTINLPGDAFWKYASLLMSANTVPNGNTFNTDASAINNEIIVVADTKPSEFHPFKDGYYSNYFDGTGDYLTFPGTFSLPTATTPFTMEAWVYFTSFSGVAIASTGYGGSGAIPFVMGMGSGSGLTAGATPWFGFYNPNSWTTVVQSSTSLSLNQWYHLAYVYTGSSATIYANGVSIGTASFSSWVTSSQTNFYIGRRWDLTGSDYFTGYLSNFRFTIGTAVYTSTFTPSTTPLTDAANTRLLLCQSNSILTDRSKNNLPMTKSGDTSVSPFNPFNTLSATFPTTNTNNYGVDFDGSDYLTLPSNTAFQMGTGDFTLECWVNLHSTNSPSTDMSCIDLRNGHPTVAPLLYLTNSGQVTYYVNGSARISGATLSTFTWYHLAVVRSSSVTTLYVNGTVSGSTYADTNNYILPSPTIGRFQDGATGFLNGTLSNVRIVKGTAIVPPVGGPTSPLTAVSGTSCLICQANTLIDGSTNAFTVTPNGNPALTKNGPFINTATVTNTLVGNEGSVYFDGTGDLLTIPNHPSHAALGTSNFTLELWFNQTVLNARDNYLISHRVSGYAPFLFWINSSGSLRSYASTSLGSWDTMNDTALATISLNTWYHLAYTRSGSTFKIFLNGAQVHSFTSSATFTTATTALNIGGQVGGGDNFTGYVSNVRFVKGTALYTSAFVPTGAPLTPVANTVLLTAQTNLSSNTKSFVDESNLNNIVSGFGNSNLGSFSPFGGTWSNYFDGTGDWLSMPSSTIFEFGTGDFTIECWAYPISFGNGFTLYAHWNNSGPAARFAFAITATGIVVDTTSGMALTFSGTTTITVGQWYHVAVTRTGSSWRTFINGTIISTATSSSTYSPTGMPVYIGDYPSDFSTGYGYISNLRVLKGTALYTANTTITSSPLVSVANTVLLTCNSNKFVDYSAANNFITRTGDAAVSKFSPFSSVTVTSASYSGYFDGTGDYLSVPSNNALDFGTGDFTVEGWVYQTSTVDPWFIISSSGSGGFFFGYNAGFGIGFGRTGVAWDYRDTGVGGGLNTWNHMAVTRSGTSMRIFYNGTQVGTTQTISTAYNLGTTSTTIGSQGAAYYFPGYISNVRVVKGTAVYTANFTPSTTPLTAIANTSLLTCQSTTFIDNSNNAFAITVNGDAKPVIQNPFTDTIGAASNYSANIFGNSVYFDGTTDYLTLPASNAFAFGSSNFTIEFWINTTQTTSNATLVNREWGGSPYTGGWSFELNGASSTAMTIYWADFSTSATFMVANTTSYRDGAWHHIAWVRNGSSFVLYIDGVSVATATNATAFGTNNNQLTIGQDQTFGSGGRAYNGYMSNLRIVKGQALYTGPFIPSNQPLPVTSNTTLLLASTVGPSTADATRNHNIETFGTARQVANNSPYYDTYSAYFDGTGDYLTFGANQANLGLGTGDFTFEFWFNAATIPSTEIDIFESQTNNSLRILKRASSSGLSFDPYGGTATLIMADASITTNTWHHVAVSRTSGTTSAYYDGTRVVNQADSTNYAAPVANYGVGGRASGANYLNGYISNMRLIKGTGLYSGTTITVPTSPLTAVANTQLLICNNNRFIDGSTNAFTITKAGDAKITAFEPFVDSNNSKFNSVYYATKTDYLAVRTQPNLITFPGDFTFECWVYPTDTSLSTAWGIWDNRQNGATAAAMCFGLAALASPVTGSWRLTYFNGTQYYGTGTVLWNQWTHVAWVRSGTTMTFYVNGVAGGTATISGTQTGTATTNPIYIGTKDNGLAGYGTVGYIADFRITNGYARTISVPTAPYDIK